MDTNEDENEDEGVDKFVVGQCGSSDISGGSSRVIIHPQPATSQGPVTHIWWYLIKIYSIIQLSISETIWYSIFNRHINQTNLSILGKYGILSQP